jgi:hypothetical protein
VKDRIPLDSLTSDQLDDLYDERDQLRAATQRVEEPEADAAPYPKIGFRSIGNFRNPKEN